MKISEIIRRDLHLPCRAVREQEVETLGLAVSRPGRTLATFIKAAEFIQDLSSDVGTVITTEDLVPLLPDRVGIVTVENPRECFFNLHNHLLAKGSSYARKTDKTVIGEGCRISDRAVIADKGVTIGDRVLIEDNVSIRENVTIENDTIVRAGCRIGGEGFEFKRIGPASYRVLHGGGVHIGHHVEIQYNSCVDKAVYPWDDTVIGPYSKIDNLVHIAHGVKLGQRVFVVAHSGIGGRTEIEDDVWVGFNVTARNGIHVGEGARLNMGSVVTLDVPPHASLSGNFAIDHERLLQLVKQWAEAQEDKKKESL